MDTNEINTQQFISVLTATLYNNGMAPMDALVTASAFMTSLDKLGMVPIEKWVANVTRYIEEDAKVEVDGVMYQSCFKHDTWFDTVVHADLITREGEVGSKLVDMVLQTEKAYPAYASHGVTRRHPIMPYNSKFRLASKSSSLMVKAVETLESTTFLVDEYMLHLAHEVGQRTRLDEQYVIDGCKKLVKDGNTPRVSEFKADRRGRLYQSDCHGPNGQSSDMARSLMDLADVPTNYDIPATITAIRDEMEDMVTGSLQDAIDSLRSTDSLVVWVMEQVELKKAETADKLPEELEYALVASKPWSFVKANRLLTMLEKGKRPYIGMAFGLDAKCSGPQYGAIMTGDIKLAEACGFGDKPASQDAYEIAIAKCQSRGIHGLTRSLIKKPYMGIFYGQGAIAFADVNSYGSRPNDHDPKLLPIIQDISVKCDGLTDFEIMELQAQKFHSAIEDSFGLMSALRKEMKLAHYHHETVDGYKVKVMDTEGPTMHMMPDNTFIAMDYKVKVDVFGDRIEYDADIKDVIVEVSGEAHKFEKLAFKTKEYNLDNYARTGFVNMIQGTDALIARHIIVEGSKLGVQHMIGVHDCFRVNICDFLSGKLHTAIERAYLNVFQNMSNGSGDILFKYFEGVMNAGGNKPTRSICNMLDRSGKLKMSDWVDVEAIINSLENKLVDKEGSYYFAK